MDESWQVAEASEWINTLTDIIYKRNVEAGWYTDLATGELKERNVGEMLALVHSEVSEALEGYRKGLPDDKLPHREMVEVELADAVIRICDLVGYLGLDLGGAIREKMEYNLHRADHKIENRKAEGGKKI